ncbi:chaperonin, 10 kDa family protein [Trichomonas vaginalis G3]|uniref:Chaperonin, 10 kDa family protein n=1 Tax=Trichomonas vaginalis (strain ATCC PRA-98 / G3) TaxID=412133 RepID=A2G3U8_TRIV3|nr:GroEs chaperonin [Trichomonas vaginalis G3]EAX88170.1 chaperonin, 10 kDa family protein [Trichomonas vaginalis G3]KAI5542565.1 GroEs chaperonin [Trichomonas vaginalis G3]|eukprot:XP_001301100.1 chaperonin, 10 kDa family protein [Trichomonas vaginalis G3]
MLATFARNFAAKKVTIKPLGSRVVVELNKAGKQKVGNLYVPESAQKTPNQATVIAVGPGQKRNGVFVPTTLKPGQKILMPEFGGQVLKFEGYEYTILNEEDILAVFE